jgi:hypothetical protein
MTSDFFDQFETQLREAVVRWAPSHDTRRRLGIPRRRLLGLPLAAISVPSAVAAAAAVVVLASNGARPTTASAAQLLTQAAAVAARQPPEQLLGAGEFDYSRQLETDTISFGHNHWARVSVQVERWVDANGKLRARAIPVGQPQFLSAADRSAWVRGGRPALAREQASLLAVLWSCCPGGHPFYIGARALSFAELRALPTSPAALRRLLEADARSYQHGPATVGSFPDLFSARLTPYEFLFAVRIIRNAPAPPALRAAAFSVLASLPGVRAAGNVHDGAGRTGTAVSVDWADARYTVIYEPGTARLLEERVLKLSAAERQTTNGTTIEQPRGPAGTMLDRITQQASAVVHGRVQRP